MSEMNLGRIKSLINTPQFLAGIVVIIGLALRMYNIEHGRGFHPDERHIIGTTEKLLEQGMNPKTFAYGSLPFYVVWIFGQIAGAFSEWYRHYDGLFTVGRAVMALTYGVSSYFLLRLSRFLTPDPRVAIFAIVLLTFNVFSLQLTRFATVDPFLTVIALGAFCAIGSAIEKPSWKRYTVVGIFFGLALGTKTSGLTLIGPIALALLWKHFPWKDEGKFFFKNIARILGGGAWIFLVASVTLFIVCPYFFFDSERLFHDQQEQIDMVRGLWRPPYTIQYAHTTAYIYPLVQIFWFTMGPPLALGCLAGLIWAAFKAKKSPSPLLIGLICWVVGFYLSTGGQFVKFPRYLLPVYPILFLFASWMFVELYEKSRSHIQLVAGGLGAIVVGWTILYGIGFENIYTKDHSYILGSEWVYEHIRPRSRILSVHWDDKLPVGLPGKSSEQYKMWDREDELPFYDRDDAEKLNKIITPLSEADYLIFPTMRIPGSIARVPEEYKESNAILSLLFEGALGYKLVHVEKPYPYVGFIRWNDDTADESFSVYDHPKVMIFKNEERLSREEIRQRSLKRTEEGNFMTPSEILSVSMQ